MTPDTSNENNNITAQPAPKAPAGVYSDAGAAWTQSPAVTEKAANTNQATFTYKLPVGAYIIASFGIATALTLWVTVLFMSSQTTPVIATALFASFAALLLTGKDIVRLITAAGSAVGVVYYGYYFVKAVQAYSTYTHAMSMYSFDSLMSPLKQAVLGALLLYGAGVVALAATCWYLLKPNVARAFK